MVERGGSDLARETGWPTGVLAQIRVGGVEGGGINGTPLNNTDNGPQKGFLS